jgi:hypothetical protein
MSRKNGEISTIHICELSAEKLCTPKIDSWAQCQKDKPGKFFTIPHQAAWEKL